MKKIKQTVILLLSVVVLSGCGESGSKKWRLDNENLTDTEVAALKLTMAMRDKIAKENKWSDLNGIDWVPILVCFPEEREKCDQFKGWNKLSGDNWATLLSEEPRFDDECDDYAGWKMMSSGNWIELLSAQAKFMKEANRNKVFDSFTNENWVSAIKSNSKVLREKCDEIKIWEKLQAKDWLDILSSNSEHIKDANAHNAWKLLKIEDWQVLISKNDAYIKEANSQKILDNLDNATWLNFIAANPKIQSVAEEKEVFKKFTPMEWANLLAKDAKYIELFKKTSSLDKLSDDNLIKLYCTQPNLRNEIFSLNRIDMDLAKSIENLYKHFGDNGEGLSGNKLVILVKIFPELKERINAETFRNYDLDSWVNVLRGDKELYDIMSKKFAYLIPWKKFTFADWVEMLDKNDDLKGMFDRYVNIKELSYPQIRKALFTGSPAFEKYDFWKEFTKEQYLLLIKDDGAAEIGMEAAAELFSGKKIRGMNDFEQAIKGIDDFEKNIVGKLVFEGDSKGATEDLKKLSDSVSKKIIYDDKFIISKARQYGIFQNFTEEQWNLLFNNLKEEKEEKQTLLIKEYLLLKKQFPSITQKLVGSNNFVVISENKLWDKLSPVQWNNFMCYTAKKFNDCYDYESKKEIAKQYQEIISCFDSLNIIEQFSDEEVLYCIEHGLDLMKSQEFNKIQPSLVEDLKNKGFWNKISKKIWMHYICEYGNFDLFYVEKAGVKNWDKKDIFESLKMYFQKIESNSPLYEGGFVEFVKTSLNALTEVEKTRLINIYSALRNEAKFPSDFIPNTEKWMFKLKCEKCREDFDKIDPNYFYSCKHVWAFSIDNQLESNSNVVCDDVSIDNKTKNSKKQQVQGKKSDTSSSNGSDDLKKKIGSTPKVVE